MAGLIEVGDWRHIGDGVYARFDGWHVVLRTEGAGEIFLDPYTFAQLKEFYEAFHDVERDASG